MGCAKQIKAVVDNDALNLTRSSCKTSANLAGQALEAQAHESAVGTATM
jgi:hypothetical protein